VKPVLEIKDLQIRFKKDDQFIHAVDGVHFEINEGETLGLVGESGSGKSVSSLAMMGLLPPNGKVIGGKIHFNGEDILTKSEKQMEKIRGRRISMIFQDPMTSLNPVLTISEQIKEVIQLHEGGTKKEIHQKAVDLLNLVKIPDAERRMSEYPHQMSGGIRQRIMIAIALAGNPSLLIADEPTTALDVTVQAQVLALIKELQIKLNMAVLLISHDLGVVAQVADKVAVMYAGQIVEYSDTKELFRSPKHPYTVGLLETIPKVDESKTELREIKGMVPDLAQTFTGCRFAARCPKSMPECSSVIPQLLDYRNTKVRCLLYTEAKEMKSL
jgi:oligopeptide/dipeptide ABC transporter ATP-binding protein